ncbi:hypothetical protein [Streptomyces xiamenensis]|uniref:hypothetical protein n=1 Tax=Streptomyces xiamenensis TaxID=408015 RepID=UPI0037D86480
MANDDTRLIPTGTCWCGCGAQVSLGKFFAPGHDKVAEAAILAVLYEGSVARLLHDHGYGPHHSIRDKAVRDGIWVTCEKCTYSGAPASVRKHTAKYH